MRHASRSFVPLLLALLLGCARPSGHLAPSTAPAAAPSGLQNLDLLKRDIKQYRSSGQWDADIARVADECTTAAREAATKGGRAAVVFDIDETLLSNWTYELEWDFARNGDRVRELLLTWVKSSECTAIEPVKRFFLAMRDAGIACFLITGRREGLRAATVRNLERQGITGWEGISFRPQDDRDPSVVPFKSGERARIEARGYTIVANIGDQESDLAGGHALKTCKLPNPMYFIP